MDSCGALQRFRWLIVPVETWTRFPRSYSSKNAFILSPVAAPKSPCPVGFVALKPAPVGSVYRFVPQVLPIVWSMNSQVAASALKLASRARPGVLPDETVVDAGQHHRMLLTPLGKVRSWAR